LLSLLVFRLQGTGAKTGDLMEPLNTCR
jgi:hypothetical protein